MSLNFRYVTVELAILVSNLYVACKLMFHERIVELACIFLDFNCKNFVLGPRYITLNDYSFSHSYFGFYSR